LVTTNLHLIELYESTNTMPAFKLVCWYAY